MTICPFCNRDPFEYVDVGVGSVPVAVTCCDLGDLYFRGARPDLEGEVTLSAEDFVSIGHRLTELAEYKSRHGELWPDAPIQEGGE